MLPVVMHSKEQYASRSRIKGFFPDYKLQKPTRTPLDSSWAGLVNSRILQLLLLVRLPLPEAHVQWVWALGCRLGLCL